MASAAAVGANADLSPPRNDIGEDKGLPGEVTSAIGSKEFGVIPNADIDDDDEDIRATARRRGPVEAAGVGDQGFQRSGEEQRNAVDDLFGDDEEEEALEKPAYVYTLSRCDERLLT